MTRRPRSGVLLFVASVGLLSASPLLAAIGVHVNGAPVQFGTVKPAQIEGRVFIPLRAVVEALGAEIKWDAATQTVRGSKGGREFTLQIGSTSATVNGQPTRLDVPAQLMQGTTMVPLRFVAEALGAKVGWNAALQQVSIEAAAVEGGPPAQAPDRVSGRLVAVNPLANPPTVTLEVDGIRETYVVGADAVVLRGAAGQQARAVDLNALRPGDEVRLRLDRARAVASVVEAVVPQAAPAPAARIVEGEVVAVDADADPRTITVRTQRGRETFQVPQNAAITRAQGMEASRRVTLGAVEIGDNVRLTADAEGRAATRVEARHGVAREAAGEVTGELVAIRADANPPTIVVRSGGSRAAYELTRSTVITRKVGTGRAIRSEVAELEPGDRVTIRLDNTRSIAQAVDAVAAAAPEAPVAAQDLRITQLTHSAEGVLRQGARFRVTVLGTPGASATVDIGTALRGVALPEDPARPGRYSALVTIPGDFTGKRVPLIASLRSGNRVSAPVQSPNTLEIDSEGPRITELTPANRATVNSLTPEIFAEISDGDGSGVDPRSVRMTVRGRDVTPELRVTSRFVIYSPRADLPAGNVSVVLQVRDMAGNQSQEAWTFTVRRVEAGVTSVAHDADRPLRAGDVVTVTAKGRPQGKAVFSIGAEGELAREVPMRETEPGVYVGRYTVKRGDQLLRAPVFVEFEERGGQKSRLAAAAPLNVVTVAPRPPTITSPVRPFRLGEELVVEGTGAPGARVIVEVTYTGRALGVVPLDGTFGSQEVDVGQNGKWVTRPFESRLPLGTRNPELTITATTVDAAGTRSEPTRVVVKPR